MELAEGGEQAAAEQRHEDEVMERAAQIRDVRGAAKVRFLSNRGADAAPRRTCSSSALGV